MALLTRTKLIADWRKAWDVMLEKSCWWQHGDRTEYEAAKKAEGIALTRVITFGMSGP